MKFQVFHVNPREKLKKKDDNNDLSHFFIIFPSKYMPEKIEYIKEIYNHTDTNIFLGHFSFRKNNRITKKLAIPQRLEINIFDKKKILLLPRLQ